MRPPFIAWHVPYVSDADRAASLDAYGERLRALPGSAPMPMPSLGGFDTAMRPLAAGARAPAAQRTPA